MDTLLLVVNVYLAFGVATALAYRLLWGGPFRFRHIFGFVVIQASMMTMGCPPDWMAPAPRNFAALHRHVLMSGDELIEGTIRYANGRERTIVMRVYVDENGVSQAHGWSEPLNLPPGAVFTMNLES